MTTDDTRRWNRNQVWLALGMPVGISVAAAAIFPLVPDWHILTLYSRLAGLVACAAGVIAALWSAYILAAIRRMGRAALQSREVLLRQFARGQRWLPRQVMVIAFLLLIGSCGVLLELAPVLPSVRWLAIFVFAALGLLLSGLWLLLRHLYPALTRRYEIGGNGAIGRAVSRSEAPLVWKLVDDVTRRARVVAPDHIVLGLDATFYATQAPLYLNGADTPLTGRSMYLSVPYLAYLRRDEAAAIIGHELAHFTGADTEYSLKFSEIYATAQQHYHALQFADDNDDGGHTWLTRPVCALMGYYLSAFDLAVQHWSREREFLADKVGAGAVTHEAAARALMCTTTLGTVIEEVLYDFTRHGGKTPHPGGLLQQVFEAVRTADSLNPMEHLEHSQPHPRDSHPPTIQRIEALGIRPGPDLIAQVNRREPGQLLQELGLK